MGLTQERKQKARTHPPKGVEDSPGQGIAFIPEQNQELLRSQPMVRALIDGVIERLGCPSAAT